MKKNITERMFTLLVPSAFLLIGCLVSIYSTEIKEKIKFLAVLATYLPQAIIVCSLMWVTWGLAKWHADIQIKKVKDELEKELGTYKQYNENALQTIRYNANQLTPVFALDTRILRDVILPVFYADKASKDKIVEKLRKCGITIADLEQYRLETNLLDTYKAYTLTKDAEAVRLNNPNIQQKT